MPQFEYKAEGSDGRAVSGTVFGITLDHAVRELSQKGIQVRQIGVAANPADPLSMVGTPYTAPSASPSAIRVEPVAAPPRREEVASMFQEVPTAPVVEFSTYNGPPIEQRSYAATSVWGPLVGTVPLASLLFFFRQGATMFEAGVPIVQALETLSGQSSSPKLKGIIRELAGHVKEGRPISAGLQRYPEVFSTIIVSLVRSGEDGGFLSEAMGIVASYLEREIELQNLYKRVTFYPKLQVGASIVIIIGANLIIDSLGGKEKLSSPLTTATTWIWLGPLIVGVFLFAKVGLANPQIKYMWDSFISRLPYIGKTIRQISMAKFGRAFGALYKGGVPVQKSLLLAADSCGNEFLRTRMHSASGMMESGRGIAETFRSTNAFSPVVLDMVDTGETTGNVDMMLNKMAEYYEDEAATRSVKTGQMMGLALGLFVAIYIGYIVITFWTGHYAGVGAVGA